MKQMVSLRESSTEDLQTMENELRENLFRARFKQSLGDAEAAKSITNDRKKLARVKTLLRARQLGIEK